jgi:hypothetical protein
MPTKSTHSKSKSGPKRATAVKSKKQRTNSAKQVVGKPFEKGNEHAFKPGQSGNPNGRPKALLPSEELRARLKEKFPDRDDATYCRMMIEAFVDLAVAGNVVAVREIFDRIEGRPKQQIDLTIDERKQMIVERTIEAFMLDTGLTRDQAIAELQRVEPEIQWVH